MKMCASKQVIGPHIEARAQFAVPDCTSLLSLTREMALLAPSTSSASLTRSIRALLLCVASLPPFSSNPLAELIASAAT